MADAQPVAPEDRGRLTVRDRAVERITATAALTAPGVERHGGGLGKLAGRDLPRVDVDITGNRVRAHLDIAVQWGRPLRIIAASVRARVGSALADQSGLVVDRVTVHVATVIPPDRAHHRELS